MRLLDRYLFSAFFKAFFGILLIFAISGLTLDFFSRIGQFTNPAKLDGTFAEGYSTVRLVFQFYVAFLPTLLKQVLPFVAVGAMIFVMNGQLRHNELFPVLASGVSARRLYAPLLVAGLLVSIGHVAFQELLMPSHNREQIALKRLFTGDKRPGLRNIPHIRDGKGTVTRAGIYYFRDQSLEGVVIHRPWTDAGFDRWFIERLVPDGEGWLSDGDIVVLPAGLDTLPQRLPDGTRVDFGVTPDEVEALVSKSGTEEISCVALARVAAKFPDRRNLHVALHKQIARPFTTFLLLLVGIPMMLSLRDSRHLGAGLVFGGAALFYGIDLGCASLGNRGDMSPIVAAYLPPAVYLSLGLARFITVPT